jgi:hypothetical protein
MIENLKSALLNMTRVGADIKAMPSQLSKKEPDVESVKRAADTADMSVLGRQLSDSAKRASDRDSVMTRDELAAYAKKQKHDFLREGYDANKKQHDLEVPKTHDRDLLERAKRATDYVNRSDKGGSLGRNSFAGLGRDQLTLVAYDDSGAFTVNERRAAWYASHDLEQAWNKEVASRGQLERGFTGKTPVFLTEVLNHYKALPEIEKVQGGYPENYVAEMEAKIRAELSLPGAEGRKKPERVLNLYDILAGMASPDKKDERQSNEPAGPGKFSPRTSATTPSWAETHPDVYGPLNTPDSAQPPVTKNN